MFVFKHAVKRLAAEHRRLINPLCWHAITYIPETRSFSSSLDRSNTIYALSSGSGKCGVAVIRISGNKAGDVLLKMTRKNTLPRPKSAFVTDIYNSKTGDHLDKALVLWFPGPRSFTGEDVCEIHAHGGIAVISSVFRALSEFPDISHAEPGEYTKRAFLNGKLDLTEVEGLGDLIHAETEEQRKQALKQMDGRLKSVVEGWKEKLLNCLAHLEAYIDFGEDQHIDDSVTVTVSENIISLSQQIQCHLDDKRRGERLRTGVKLAIIGKPNVGKSSLLNLITARPAAIVSPIAGTTRDIVESNLDINGFPVIISDTAGIRDTTDIIESEGVRRARLKASEADLIVHVIDAYDIIKESAPEYLANESSGLLTEGHEEQRIFYIINKCDLISSHDFKDLQKILIKSEIPHSMISCKNQFGFESFFNKLSIDIKNLCQSDNSSLFSPSLTQERHRAHVSNCLSELNDFINIIDVDVVIAAEYLRLAMNHLGKLTGKICTEDILDVIFKDFCIGK